MQEELLTKRAQAIRGMFGRIAHRYDLLNRLLSLGQDLRWRRLVAERVADLGPERLLDVCTGTGDLAVGLDGAAAAYGSDFCLPMLAIARRKRVRGRAAPTWFAADSLRLPVADGSFDAVTVAFGVRNFEDLQAGLRELTRVLRSDGRLLVLEFSRPRGSLGPLLRWWVDRVPPVVGRLVSGDAEAYRYLTASVASFPEGDRMAALMEAAGLQEVEVRPLTWGVATLYDGRRG
jgi:demethylmenaquinone methyltransferase/2-methoxy-6-polyprenyl-1,4-benzoquinol methylase